MAKRSTIRIKPGVEPVPDNTEKNTLHWIDADGVRFDSKGMIRELDKYTDLGIGTVDGVARSMFNYYVPSGNLRYTVIATNMKLYALLGTTLTNITPLSTTTTAIAASLDTRYDTLANNPIRTRYDSIQTAPIGTVNGSRTLTILTFLDDELSVGDSLTVSGSADVNGVPAAQINATHVVISFSGGGNPQVVVATAATATSFPAQAGIVITIKKVQVTQTAHGLVAGDIITLAGATTTGGVPNTDINGIRTVSRVIDADDFHIVVATTATSLASGGGAAVILSNSTITVNAAAHGMLNGDRVKIAGAAATGGIPNTEINAEHIIRNVSTNAFDIRLTTVATSSVTGGGGAGTTYQKEIADGQIDSSPGYGFGMGLFGAGLFGTGRSGTNPISPRIWSGGRFGSYLILSPGGQTGVYQWDGNLATAPALVTNAPTAVNWAYVTNNILVTLGASGTPNRRKWSDQGAHTTWTAAASNQAGDDDIEGADQFISHLTLGNEDLLFTGSKVYIDSYIGMPLIFANRELEGGDGLIGPMARAAYGGIAYWMGKNNLMRYYGGRAEIIPGCTLKDYLYGRLNRTQQEKCWIEVRAEREEVWFYYPSTNGDEVDSYVIYQVPSRTWTPGTMERTAAAQGITFDSPRLINSGGSFYLHEQGGDAYNTKIYLTVTTRFDKRGATEYTYGLFEISSNTTRIFPRAKGNMRKYRIEGTGANNSTWFAETNYQMIGEGDSTFTIMHVYPDSVQTDGNPWRMGRWVEEIQAGGNR